MRQLASTQSHESPNDVRTLTVSQLNRASRDLLETYLSMLWVEGEISNFSAPSSGHWYFTLKDAKAQVRCAMFRNRNLSARFRPEAGQKVLLKGKPSIYEGRGDFQLIGEEIKRAGEGDLQLAFDKLKAKLLALGWFDKDRKKPLPAMPSTLCVISSATGAVIHDICHVLARRFPLIKIHLLPVAVQGKEAAPQIAAAIGLANQHHLGDAIIVARGGGSLEDLWAFNEELVAEAIMQSRLPVVSAVGHEVDFTIADFVADVRAPTPSAAAEMLSPDGPALLKYVKDSELKLKQAVLRHLTTKKQHIKLLQSKLKHPGQTIRAQAQRIDQLELRLVRAIKQQINASAKTTKQLNIRLSTVNPKSRLPLAHQMLRQRFDQLKRAQTRIIEAKTQALAQTTQLLNSVSPLNTLQRGYAILHADDQRIVRSSESVKPGDKLTARLGKGQLAVTVDKIASPQIDSP